MLEIDVATYCSRIHFSGGDAHQHQSDALQNGRQDAQTPGIAELVICKTLKIILLYKSFAGIFGLSFWNEKHVSWTCGNILVSNLDALLLGWGWGRRRECIALKVKENWLLIGGGSSIKHSKDFEQSRPGHYVLCYKALDIKYQADLILYFTLSLNVV